MSDQSPTRQTPDQEPSPSDQSSLKGLTMAVGIQPADPSHDPLLGRDIGGVTIVRLIAEGGMGRVYEGLQDSPRRKVAVKVMRPGFVSRQTSQRFAMELEILGRLRHPYIAQIYSAGMCDVVGSQVPFFVMEYIPDALSLTRHAQEKMLGIDARIALFQKVCEAVAHGHEQGIVHRDLKPSNILVEATGIPKIIDFGIARTVGDTPEQMTALTELGQLIGTLQYMSPEQIAADPKAIDQRTDVYALGVILYELLTGKPPYEIRHKQIFEAAKVVREQKPVSPAKLNQSVRPDLVKITGTCLHKDRNRRYASAVELAKALGTYLGGSPLPERPRGSRNVFGDARGRPWRTRPALLWLMLGVPLLGIVATAGWLFLKPSASLAVRETAASKLKHVVDGEGVAITGYTGQDPVVVIPRSIEGRPVVAIQDRAFAENAVVTCVIFPKGLRRIGGDAFQGCRELTEVVIPDGVREIGNDAFSGTNLRTLDLPASVEKLGKPSESTPYLKTINVAAENPFYTSIDGILYDKNAKAVIRCPENRTDPVVLPESVRVVANRAFLNCKHVEEIAVPQGVEQIGGLAFYGCESLRSIAIPPKVKKIEAQTFVLCGRLAEVFLSEGLESIDSGVFWGCGQLTRIRLPASLVDLHEKAFEHCPAKIERAGQP